MSGVKDWTDLGILPLQDHDADAPSMSARQMVVGARVSSLPSPRTHQEPGTMVIGTDWGKGTIGDLHPFWFWQTRDREQRGMGMWGQAHPCIVSEFFGVQPVYGWDWKQDARFIPAVTTIPSCFGTFPRGTVAVALHGTEDLEQQELLVHTDPRMVCPSVGGPIDAATKVVDMQPDGELCVKGGKRVAPIQTMMRVVPFFSANESIGGGSLAWNCASALGGGATHGLSWFKLDTGSVGPIRPSGPGGPIRPTGPSGPITGPRSVVAGASLDGPGNPNSGTLGAADLQDDGPGFGAGFPEGFSPDEFGIFIPVPDSGHGSACMAQIPTYGPFHGGHAQDKHHLLDDADGNPLNSGHISTNAYFYRDRDKDGPLLFEGDYPNPAPLPLQSRVHLTWDGSGSHAGSGTGTQNGHWRWWAEVSTVSPDVPSTPKVPNTPTGGGRPGGPITGGPNNPGGPGPGAPMKPTPPPGPGGPITGGPAPGAPAPAGNSPGAPGAPTPPPWLGHPITPNPANPNVPGGARFPGHPITGGRAPGPGAPIPGLPTPGGQRGGSTGKPVNPGGPIKPGQGPGSGGGGKDAGGEWEPPPREDYEDWDPIDYLEEQTTGKRPQDSPSWYPRYVPPAPYDTRPDDWVPQDQPYFRELRERRDRWLRGRTLTIGQMGTHGNEGTNRPLNNNQDPDGYVDNADERESLGVARSVGEVFGRQHLYAIHHPMMETFASMAMRPQLWIKGYPNFEHGGPFAGAVMIKRDEEVRPQTLAMRSWGGQAEGDWAYIATNDPARSRARGGIVNGGILIAPPEFEMEDYFGISETLDVDAPVSEPIMLFAPGTAMAFGKPSLDGGMTNGNGWAITQTVTGERPLVIRGQESGTTTKNDLMTLHNDVAIGEVHAHMAGSNHLRIPYGDTRTRPATAYGGSIRVQTGTGLDELEWYDSQLATWKQCQPTGGVVTAFTMSTARMLGRSTASSGAVEEITIGANLTLASGELSADAQAQSTLRYQWFEHYGTASASIAGWGSSSSGTGAGFGQNWDVVSLADVFGVGELRTGTDTTGRYALTTYNNALDPQNDFGMSLEVGISLQALSTASEEFVLRIGFGEGWLVAGHPSDGAYFRYERSVDGDLWSCVTSNTESHSKTVTVVAPTVGGTFQRLKIVWDPGGDELSFLIDGNEVANHTTGAEQIPTTRLGLGIQIEKTAGTTSRELNLDFHDFILTRTTEPY
jgi:hypothetical protein